MSDELAVAVCLLAALVFAAVAWLVVRRSVITRNGGVVECGLRPLPGTTWQHGLAEYRPGQLCWHRFPSFRLRPEARFDRAGLRIVGTRRPTAAEVGRFGPGVLIAECETGPALASRPDDVQPVELAMSEAALTGLLSWLESSPEYHLRAG